MQTAACLPPTLVVRAHRDMASSLNLALVYVGGDQLPAMSSTTTRWDGYETDPLRHMLKPSGQEFQRAISRSNPWNNRFVGARAQRTTSYARILADFDSFRPIAFGIGGDLRTNLQRLWTGEPGIGWIDDSEVRVAPNTTRLIARFHHQEGRKLPLSWEAFTYRLLWSDRRDGVQTETEYTRSFSHPQDAVTLDDAAMAVYRELLHAEDVSLAIDTDETPSLAHRSYHHLKLAALHALTEGRFTVTAADFQSIQPIIDASVALRDELYRNVRD
ncbi:MAG: hypothetical protein KDB26_05680 [Microthrixaceae bacterium]|nr:hypothetical protein [Microthrixaceae bacterium]